MNKSISKNKPRVVVAMSGGVDSSVAAYLLKKEYEVVGIFLKLWEPPCDYGCDVGAGSSRPNSGAVTAPLRNRKQNLCCDDKAMAIARQIAEKLEIPFYVLKVDNYFKKEIVDNFISEYEKGLTPNPCVRCNRHIKFGYLWQKAKELKADYLATGHYVCKEEIKKLGKLKKLESAKQKFPQFPISPISCIFRSKDIIKDQTYFLSTIDSSIIPHLLFPIGNMDKKEVREIARKAKLPVYNKKDSQGICFIPDGDNVKFLKSFSKKLQKPGDIVDLKGNVFGRHSGLMGYTIGQKVGDSKVTAKYFKITNNKLQMSNKCQNPNDKKHHRLSSSSSCCTQQEIKDLIFDIGNLKFKSNVPRLYVISIDVKKNQLVVGENNDCFSDSLIAENFNVIDQELFEYIKNKKPVLAQIRGGHKPEKCRIISVGAGSSRPKQGAETAPLQGEIKIQFFEPVRAVTPGQTVAVYTLRGKLLGGGIIKK